MVSSFKLVKSLTLSTPSVVSSRNKENCSHTGDTPSRVKAFKRKLQGVSITSVDPNTALDIELNQLLMEGIHKLQISESQISQPPIHPRISIPLEETLKDSVLRLRQGSIQAIDLPMVTFEGLDDVQLNYCRLLLAYNKLIELVLRKNSEICLFNVQLKQVLDTLADIVADLCSLCSSKSDIEFDSTASD
ncbi:uncharacterized protein CANTADRAFT_26167 [Suhomyces tanzawaensis NRRL Y-17324]|uniref:Uncharacterized protein n=1 Tax=Suhomyces tanzawaensis NRRL Y-17324 TaxID=984487 RepID=A0A1E4SHZ5_9ASCO|nr:uncharacterized protein CANTADRAFT_26167 [Suhomyces tanzawaensis NRRL Y-17324]ODV79125.1 hypothetical protein CANTADRAFT_26167 [Suhomyces tanzawaensis NRRL Y-17324]